MQALYMILFWLVVWLLLYRGVPFIWNQVINTFEKAWDTDISAIPTEDEFFDGISFPTINNTWEDTKNTWNILTGVDNKYTPKTDYELFQLAANTQSVFLPLQPQYARWSYGLNTEQLVNYARINMQEITLPVDISPWYLLIRTKTAVPNNRSVVLYVQMPWWRCWGALRKDRSLSIEWNEYLYKLSDVDLIWSSCDEDWWSKIAWQTIYIGWYVGTFDGNHIEEITIAWQ